jgi:hypothetical protein
MTRSYPETIPAQLAAFLSLTDAYKRGWSHGHGIACHNVPTLGDRLFVDDLGRVTVDAENIREVHASLCYSAESNSRQFSPFEFTAHEFNSAGEGDDGNASSEELWEAFEQGASDAIAADLAEYDDEAYGIEADDAPAGRADAEAAGFEVHHDLRGWYVVAPDEERDEGGFGPDGVSLGFDGRAHFEDEDEAWEHAASIVEERA